MWPILKEGLAYVSVLITFRQNIISLDASLFLISHWVLDTCLLPNLYCLKIP